MSKRTYDYTTIIDRSTTGSAKWNAMKEANPNITEGIIPFSVADLDIPLAPEITEGLKRFLDTAVLGYTRPTQAYTDAVTGWMARRHDWAVEDDWIVQSSGVVPAFFTAVRAFTEPGEGVIIQTPAYYPFYMAIELNDRQVVRNPLVEQDGGWTINMEELERLAADKNNTMLLFCSPHNPTGRVWTREELGQVAEIAARHDLVVVSDEIHFDLVMPGHHHTVFSTLPGMADRTVVCTAPSKTFNLAGMQTSNIMISDPAKRERFTAEQMKTASFGLNALGYEACRLAYTEGEPWLEGLLELIRHNHEVTKQFMADHMPWCTVYDLEGTYLQWLDFRGLGLDPEELQRRHVEAMVFFDEGTMFGPEGAGFERISLAAPTAAVVAALERLAKAHS